MINNIFPHRDQFLERTQKEALIHQHGLVIWFTGLSGAGKSTLAVGLERMLYAEGILTQVLDGDKIRNGLSNNLGFAENDRIENIRRIAEVGRLFSECGVVTLSAFISPTHTIRAMARGIIGNDNFFEVHVSTPLSVCEQRDTKGLYQKARAGLLNNFTGISAPYEEPLEPNLSIDTSLSIDESVALIIQAVIARIRI